MRTRDSPLGRARFAGAWLCLCLAGCGGHAAKTLEARTALDAGRPKLALSLLNEDLGVKSEKEIPKELGGDGAVLLLDRAMVLQSLDRYDLSEKDLQVADKQIEILDLSRNAVDDLGRYLFSDSAGAYKAPAYEKLMINTMNMVNYLVQSDLDGARVEARRLAVMQRFLSEHENPGASLLGPGSYLAGFTFEKSGKPDDALRYYDEALKYGKYRTLAEPIRRLAKSSSYRSPRIRAILGKDDPRAQPPPPPPATPAGDSKTEAEDATKPTAEEPAAEKPEQAPEPVPYEKTYGEVLVIVSFGRVPAKYAKRVPIGLALTYASGALSGGDRARANSLALQGLVTWVNYPELGAPHGEYDVPDFGLDGAWQPLEGIVAVDREARRAWDEAKGAVIASAITRMIARVVAGEAVRRGSGGGILGALLGLGTQAALTAADTPDTRCWATLPARIAFGRIWVKPGRHVVTLIARGLEKRQKIDIRAGDFQVVNLTVLR
jgi:tetratricopeptide (TPR) repeat protein